MTCSSKICNKISTYTGTYTYHDREDASRYIVADADLQSYMDYILYQYSEMDFNIRHYITWKASRESMQWHGTHGKGLKKHSANMAKRPKDRAHQQRRIQYLWSNMI